MPLPVFFIGAAVATGGAGVVKSVKAGIDARTATKMNEDANALVESTTARLNAHLESCGTALSNLGEEKVFVLENSMKTFLDTFTKLKNVDFKETEGLSELSKMRIDEKEFDELKSMVNFAASLTGGAVAGTAGGALVAFGAYGAAQALACASTGTAIASLSGAAATNATLAFFGGGSIAAGGLGMAGGTAVLGGLVAGPALLVLGLVAGRTADKELDKARTNRAEAMQIASQLETSIMQCEATRGRTYLFYNLIARLDARFLPLVFEMEDNFSKQGDDFSSYDDEAKRIVASCAGVAVAIKTVLDTPMLTDDGLLTDESEATATNVTRVLHEKGIANAKAQRQAHKRRRTPRRSTGRRQPQAHAPPVERYSASLTRISYSTPSFLPTPSTYWNKSISARSRASLISISLPSALSLILSCAAAYASA